MTYPTLYKTVIFTVFVAAFTLAEHVIKAFLKGEGLTGGLTEYFAKEPYEFLAGSLIIFVAFIPFFGVKGLAGS